MAVHALIAHTTARGEKALRALELRLLGAGITVSRSSDDLVKYHDKLLIVDDAQLFVFGFNFTRNDVGKRRSMAVSTRKRVLVAKAVELFEADATRQPFAATKLGDLVISPVNARERLARFLRTAKRSLWIYDPQAIDAPMLRLLRERSQADVDGASSGRSASPAATARGAVPPTCSCRARDPARPARALRRQPGLRGIELDRRREVGILVRDRSAIKRFKEPSKADWRERSSRARKKGSRRLIDAPLYRDLETGPQMLARERRQAY